LAEAAAPSDCFWAPCTKLLTLTLTQIKFRDSPTSDAVTRIRYYPLITKWQQRKVQAQQCTKTKVVNLKY